MKSLRSLDRRVGFSLGAVGLLLGMVAPAALPAFASAAQISSRSIQMSSSVESATGVKYDVAFTPAASASDVVLWFCANSPLAGAACTAPAGMSLSSATLTAAGSEGIVTSSYTGAGANYLVFNGAGLTGEIGRASCRERV